MSVKIRSLLTSGPVVVPLSSGRTVRLSPGQVSPEMPDVEVADNAKVDKLRQMGVIEVEVTPVASGPPARATAPAHLGAPAPLHGPGHSGGGVKNGEAGWPSHSGT